MNNYKNYGLLKLLYALTLFIVFEYGNCAQNLKFKHVHSHKMNIEQLNYNPGVKLPHSTNGNGFAVVNLTYTNLFVYCMPSGDNGVINQFNQGHHSFSYGYCASGDYMTIIGPTTNYNLDTLYSNIVDQIVDNDIDNHAAIAIPNISGGSYLVVFHLDDSDAVVPASTYAGFSALCFKYNDNNVACQ
jgi:hypothetical protein